MKTKVNMMKMARIDFWYPLIPFADADGSSTKNKENIKIILMIDKKYLQMNFRVNSANQI